MEQQPAGPLSFAREHAIETLATTYSEHEVRMATYHGRDLNHKERLNLGIEGLTRDLAFHGVSVDAFEVAADVLEIKLKDGETVGASLAAALRAIPE